MKKQSNQPGPVPYNTHPENRQRQADRVCANSAGESADVLLITPASAIEIFEDRGTRHIVIRELPFADIGARVLRLTPDRARLVAGHLVKLADRIERGGAK